MTSGTEHGRRRAVVIGASIGGLVAARALTDAFDEVVVIERDMLVDDAAPRKGVPQGRHAHGLLASGLRGLERLFPGFAAEMVAAGAVTGDIQGDSLWHASGFTLASAPSGLQGLLASRGLVEQVVRRRVAELANVTLATGASVEALTGDAARVRGVRLADGTTVIADLVVDASGRGSRAPSWLRALGLPEPEAETVEVGISYTSRLYRRRPLDFGGRRAILVGVAPGNWRYGVALAQEGDRFMVTVGGYFGDEAPTDDAGFTAFAQSLDLPDIGRFVLTAEPLSEPVTIRYPVSTRRRFERLAAMPAGFVVFGDAFCSFNPVYGQGMSSAVLQAEALAASLSGPEESLPSRFHRAAATIVDAPWRLAAGGDFRHPALAPKAPLPVRLINAYVARMHRVAAREPVVGRAFLEVANLLAPPSRIFRPTILARVLLGASGRIPSRPARREAVRA